MPTAAAPAAEPWPRHGPSACCSPPRPALGARRRSSARARRGSRRTSASWPPTPRKAGRRGRRGSRPRPTTSRRPSPAAGLQARAGGRGVLPAVHDPGRSQVLGEAPTLAFQGPDGRSIEPDRAAFSPLAIGLGPSSTASRWSSSATGSRRRTRPRSSTTTTTPGSTSRGRRSWSSAASRRSTTRRASSPASRPRPTPPSPTRRPTPTSTGPRPSSSSTTWPA